MVFENGVEYYFEYIDEDYDIDDQYYLVQLMDFGSDFGDWRCEIELLYCGVVWYVFQCQGCLIEGEEGVCCQ